MAVAEAGTVSLTAMREYLAATLRTKVDVLAVRPLGDPEASTDPTRFDPADLSWLCGDGR